MHWATLWGRPQRWHAKRVCVTPNKKERVLTKLLSMLFVSINSAVLNVYFIEFIHVYGTGLAVQSNAFMNFRVKIYSNRVLGSALAKMLFSQFWLVFSFAKIWNFGQSLRLLYLFLQSNNKLWNRQFTDRALILWLPLFLLYILEIKILGPTYMKRYHQIHFFFIIIWYQDHLFHVC